MNRFESAIEVLEQWYAELDTYQDGLPAKGSIAAALHVLERMTTQFDLEISSHVAEGEAQIKGLSPGNIKKLLNRFGESRTLSSIAGRTNRGARGDTGRLLNLMRTLQLESVSVVARNEVIAAMQRHIVATFVPRHFAAKRVKSTFNSGAATKSYISTILNNARMNGKAGAVAEYLVGAKLAVLYPELDVRNKRFSVSDVGHEGDFQIGTTVFHVTTAPMPELYEKLKSNLDRGFRVYLLVTEDQVVGARQIANVIAEDKIAVEPIESFVATNVDEASRFDASRLKADFRRLLEAYNARVDAIELDKSMLIEIPPNV